MPAPKRYFDNDSAGGPSPAKRSRGDFDGGRGASGRGRGGGARGASRGGRGAGRGGRGGGAGRSDYQSDRPQKEAFKPKEGFIAAGLKAYTDAAAAKAETPAGEADISHHTTLYVSNVPLSLTSPQLSLIFSSYAPVRAAFVVSTAGAGGAKGGDDKPSFAGSSTNAISVKAGRDRTGKSTSRGFGYVRFVLRSDADQCLKEWGSAKDGLPRSAVRELEGQEGLEHVEWDKVCGPNGIKLQWAKKKLREGEEPEGGPKKVKKEKKPVVEAAEANEDGAEVDAADEPQRKWRPGVWDYNAPRTVVVLGLPLPGEAGSTEDDDEEGANEAEDADGENDASKMDVETETAAEGSAAPAKKGKPIDFKKALRQRARKIGDVEDVKFPYELPSGDQGALVVMYTPRHAHELMKKLNNHVFRGQLLSAAVKSSWDLCQRLGRGKGGGRLLVRNLGFDVTIADLRTTFARFGSLHSITLPVDPATSKPRGFAFVYYVTRSDAETALKKVNGTRIYAGMAAERIASEGGKEGKKKDVREKKKAEKASAGGGGGEKGRVVAVDWALGKEEWKKAQEGDKVEGEAAASDASSEDEESDSDDDDDDDEEGSSDEDEDEDSDTSPVPEDLEDRDTTPQPVGGAEDDGLDEDEEEEEKPKAQGTTLFVRNISFEATEAELYDLFKQFGRVRYARIVYDPATKRSRGTAFVCFWDEEDAQAVIDASQALNEGSFGETSTKKTSLLMADPGSSAASPLTLHGRVLAAVPAVSKGDADKLREERDKKGAAKTDRRNLYLMREGVIFPSWAIAKTLSASDMDARQASFDARKALLRSNPSLYISRTRLSIRQIPLYVTDGMLKRLANYAIREFDREVKSGLQKPLTSEELVTFVADASGAKEPTWNKVERKKGIPLGKVRQSKILRQTDRVDPVTGLGRSKGYGFLELGTHADALKFLRWANANKEVNRLFRSWWREELDKLVDLVEKGEGKIGKNVKATEKEDRLNRLLEKRKELEEEEKIAAEKEVARVVQGKGAGGGESGRSSRCLIIEFSIENAVTTRRRAEKADRAREKARRAKERGGEESEEEEEGSDAETESASPKKGGGGGGKRDSKGGKDKGKGKKRRADDDADAASSPSKKKSKKGGAEAADGAGAAADEPAKEGARIGSMIGRKRKQKKGGK